MSNKVNLIIHDYDSIIELDMIQDFLMKLFRIKSIKYSTIIDNFNEINQYEVEFLDQNAIEIAINNLNKSFNNIKLFKRVKETKNKI